MPITVKHSVDAYALGRSAYAGGRGARAERDAVRAEAVDEAEKNRKLRREEIAARMAMGMAQLNTEAYNQPSQGSLDYARHTGTDAAGIEKRGFEAGAKLEQQRYDESPDRALDMLEAKQRLDQKNERWAYTELQKRENEKLTDAINFIDSNDQSINPQGIYRAGEAANLRKQAYSKKYAISPNKVYDDKPSPQELFEANQVVDKDSGRRYYYEPGAGKPPVPYDRDDIRVQADIKEQEMKIAADRDKAVLATAAKFMETQVVKGYEGKGKDRRPITGPMFSPQESLQKSYELVEGLEKLKAQKAAEKKATEQGAKDANADNQLPGEITIQLVNDASDGDPKAVKQMTAIAASVLDKENLAEFKEVMEKKTSVERLQAISRVMYLMEQ